MFITRSLLATQVLAFLIPRLTVSSLPYPPPKFETTVYTLTGPKTFIAQTAVFGKELQNNITYNANLWLPPGDLDLCSYPNELLENVSKSDMEVIDATPVALLISRGNCSFDDKARVALEVKENLLSNLRFLLVVNNNRTHPDELVIMSTSAYGTSKELLGGMSYLLVSKTSGDRILRHLHTYAEATNQSPYLGSDVNTSWMFMTTFRQHVPTGSKSRNHGRGGAARSTFHWLRFVLFSLLIVSPCARAVYLWYSAGGRVMFRRTEDGRITGLMYVRPMPYWFASGQTTNNSEDEDPGHCNLTEEQVLELPEIKFKKSGKGTDEDGEEEETRTQQSDDDMTGSTSPVVDEEQAVPDVVVQKEPVLGATTSGSTNNSSVQTTQSTDFVSSELTATSTPSDDEDVVVVPTTEEIEQHDKEEEEEKESDLSSIETSCTMCSICIDDFEEGEKIRVLPRCGHAYHFECLKPWLTERQGCCPLCKTPVLGPEPSASSSGEQQQQQEEEETSENATTTDDASQSNSTTTTNDCPA